MTTEPQAIEVEVVAIDGAVPPPAVTRRPDAAPRGSNAPPWMEWQGRLRTLDSRWWPLWVVLGTLALALLLTVGVVVGVIWLVFQFLRGLMRAIFR